MAKRRPVVAIPPSYNKNEDLETDSTKSYLNYLKQNGAECVMTTAGTSQFNLLSTEEIHTLNKAVSSFEGQKVLGVPALSLRHTIEFIKQAKGDYLDEDSNLMVLYPDRYYYDSVLESFLEAVTDHTDKVYLHTPKMRNGKGGDYEYSSRIISSMFTWGLAGIKEENSSLQQSYDFVRGLPEGLDVEWRDNIPRPSVFDSIQEWGEISDEEMKSVFNNGVGMCMVVSPEEEDKIASEIPLDGKAYPHIIQVGQIK